MVFFLMGFTSFSQVTSAVFKNFDMNGTKGTVSPNLEVGMAGVVVNATKPDAMVLTVTHTRGGT